MDTQDKEAVPSGEKIGMPKRESKWPDTPAKWIELLGTPLTILLAVSGLIWGVYQFNAQQVASTQMQTAQEAASAAQALDQQRQTVLDTYLDRMSDLLLTYHLSASKPGDEVRALAQARTYTALRNLDGSRKGTLVRFLWGAELINGLQPIISMLDADLSGAIISEADMSGINLSGAILGCSNPSGKKGCADLSRSRLCGFGLSGQKVCADLSGAILAGTDMSGDFLDCADASSGRQGCADLSKAYLCGTRLTLEKGCADLNGAYLDGANLSGATLCGVSLNGQQSCADLSGADLSGADLSGAILCEAGLDGQKICADLSGAYYNTKPFRYTDPEGFQITVGPTQWPEGFDPKSAGAKCSPC